MPCVRVHVRAFVRACVHVAHAKREVCRGVCGAFLWIAARAGARVRAGALRWVWWAQSKRYMRSSQC
eukprot:967990-Alexandrium_andersonii.AAC.1